jgi:hypothetical protein
VTAEVYDLVGYRVRVSASSAEGGAAIRRALSGFGPVASEDAGLPTFGLDHSGRDWHVQREGVPIQIDSSLAGATAALEWHLVVAAIAHRHDSFHLHGGALSVPGGGAAIALMGHSGSGKTTLTLALMNHSFEPFADDVVLLDRHHLTVDALRRAFHVSDDTRRLVRPLRLLTPEPGTGTPAGWSWPERWATGPLPVRWVLTVERGADGEAALQTLSQAEATAGVLRHASHLKSAPSLSLNTAARLVESAVCRRLIVGELAATVALVVDLVGEG